MYILLRSNCVRTIWENSYSLDNLRGTIIFEIAAYCNALLDIVVVRSFVVIKCGSRSSLQCDAPCAIDTVLALRNKSKTGLGCMCLGTILSSHSDGQ